MLKLKDGLILYHGSYCEVKEPDLAKCAKRKDFGQGFYLTTSKEQAASFLKTSIAKAIAAGKIEENQNFGYISTYEIKLLKELQIHMFEEADVNWLHCIAAHRKKKLFYNNSYTQPNTKEETVTSHHHPCQQRLSEEHRFLLSLVVRHSNPSCQGNIKED